MSTSARNPTPAEIWERALQSESGIKLSTDDPALLKQRLYQHKYAVADMRMNEFEIGITDKEVWLIRGGRKNAGR